MATSGQVQTNTAFGWVKLAWSTSSQSVEGNTSTVAYTLSIYRSSNISSSAAKSYTITINGTRVASGTTSIGGSGTKTIKSGTTTILHNADGSKSFSFSFSQQIDITWSGSWIGTVTGSGTGTLNTIPRATTPTLSASSVAMGTAVTISTPRASSSFTHTLTYSFGGSSGTIATGVTTSQSWTPPVSLAASIPSAVSGPCTITCKTYSGSTLIGSKSVTLTLTVPASVVPTISSVSMTEATAGLAAQFGAYVQNKSTLAVAITAAGAQGSTISTYRTTIQGVTYTAGSFTSQALTASGTSTVTVTVTDSRGRTATYTTSLTVLAYFMPRINSMSAYRINTGGTADDEGTRVAAAMNFQIAEVGTRNDHTYSLEYKRSGTSTYTQMAGGSASWTYSGTQSFTSAPEISTDYAYVIRLTVTDYFGSVSLEVEVPTAFVIMDFRSTGKGLAFGKVSEADRLEIAMDLDLTGDFLQEAIQTPTLQNSWVNYGAGYQGAGYWRDKCGVVHLCGLIKSGTTTAETVIFTLPAGYRPAGSEKFFTVSLNAICVIDVYASGAVAIKTGANPGWLSLSGISFKA